MTSTGYGWCWWMTMVAVAVQVKASRRMTHRSLCWETAIEREGASVSPLLLLC